MFNNCFLSSKGSKPQFLFCCSLLAISLERKYTMTQAKSSLGSTSKRTKKTNGILEIRQLPSSYHNLLLLLGSPSVSTVGLTVIPATVHQFGFKYECCEQCQSMIIRRDSYNVHKNYYISLSHL